MDRLIALNSVPFASADTAPATGAPQYGTSGNPATNTPATVWPAYAFNAVQDEIYNVIIAAGLTPARNTWNQLLTAIQTMLQGGVANVGVDTGAANAYVVAFSPALSAPIPYVPFWFKAKTTNTGPSTLNATGTVEPLLGGAHLPLQGNELVANGSALIYWNPTLAAGAGSYVLMFCSGASEQTAPATQPAHAMQLGQAVGRLLNIQTFTSSGTYTPTVGTTHCLIKACGGGGGGGGAGTTAAGSIVAASAGTAAGYVETFIANPGATTVTIGAMGQGVNGAAGSAGGSTTFGALLTAGGGVAGVAANTTPPLLVGNGVGGTATGGTLINLPGQPATPAFGISTVDTIGGNGGSGPLGSGGAGSNNGGNGFAATGHGAGGGGASNPTSSATPFTGGNASPGIVLVFEYA